MAKKEEQSSSGGLSWYDLMEQLEKLKKSKDAQIVQAFELLFDNCPVALFVVDNKTAKLVKVNKEFCRISGYTKEEAVGMTFEAFVAEEDFERVSEYRRRRILGDVTIPASFEMLVKTKPGDKRVVKYYAKVIPFTDVIFGAAIDITESKILSRSSDDFGRAETLRMATGMLAGELKNLLSTIVGYAESTNAHNQETSYVLGAIKEAAKNALELVQPIVELSQDTKSPFDRFDAVKSIKYCVAVVSRKQDVAIEVNAEEGRWYVRGDRTRFEEAILHILFNAVEASKEGKGVVFIEVSELEGHSNILSIRIRDTGMGLPPDIDPRRLFEPFFTTKKRQQHVGLGLYLARNAINHLSGTIECYNCPAGGAVFEVRLPIALEPELPELADTEESRKPVVLVVEDEDLLRQMVVDILEAENFEVVSLRSGKELLSWMESGNEADVLLLDIILPDADGRALVYEVKRRRPRLPIVLTSAYYWSRQDDVELAQVVDAFVAKPFNPSELLTILASLTEKRGGKTG